MEQKIIAQFIEENMKTIYAYSLSRVSHKEDAEDLAGEIIIAILQSASKIKNEDAFFGYIWAIAGNTYKKFLRKRNRAQYTELDENMPLQIDFVEDICRSEEVNNLHRELALLSREYRECTVAYYFDGLSCAETAEKLHISLEMVKYYLFKTRKLLKEGIGMEREFGEKSYKPATFEFRTIFTGKYNAEYSNLFKRKLPGNILLSAYYTPMTIRELSIELGVASAYMEDEVALLEKYDLLTALSGGKYQTKLVIFTEAYMNEFYRCAESFCQKEIRKILESAKEKLVVVRKVGFNGNNLEDYRLLWAFLWLMMRNGYQAYKNDLEMKYQSPQKIYGAETGTNYGQDFNEYPEAYATGGFAGYAKIDETYAGAAADFGILPKKNHYFANRDKIKSKLDAVMQGECEPEFVIFKAQEENAVAEILQDEIKQMAEVYKKLVETAVDVLKVHAPKGLEEQVQKVVIETIFFNTVGFIGACAFKSCALKLPEDDKPIAFYVYQYVREDTGLVLS